MIDLEKIKNKVLKGTPVEDLLEKFNWKEFEEAVAEIFSENGLYAKRNVRFKTDRRFEIDIVASKPRKVFCVDCKEWSRGRNKKSGITHAAELQKERTLQFEKFLSKNIIARNKLRILEQSKFYRFYPILVTLFEEDLKDEGGVVVVPVWKLNSFLNSEEFSIA